MDQLVSDIRKHSVEGEYKLLAGKLQSSADQIAGLDVVTLDSILDSLEPGKHTLGIMAALYVSSGSRRGQWSRGMLSPFYFFLVLGSSANLMPSSTGR